MPRKLYELIKDVKIAMMTTVDTDGTLHSRPMHNQEADEHGDLWFFTQIQSPKITEISRDNEVNLAYSDPSSQTYVSVTGRAEIVRDKANDPGEVVRALAGLVPEGRRRSADRPDPRPSGEGRVLGQPVLDAGASLRLREGRRDRPAAESGRSGEGQSELIARCNARIFRGRLRPLFFGLYFILPLRHKLGYSYA